MANIIYKPSKTLKSFHKDDSFVRAIAGPIGSGKSVGCIVELLIRAYAQEPNEQGVRKTRWAIIRNTYRELLDTTLKSFEDWVPMSTGIWSALNMTFTHRQYQTDGSVVEAEFLFRALDRPNDVKKLLSLELTGGFINECREVPKQVVDMMQGRVGRYPRQQDGGPTWYGVIMDTNYPDSDHWFYHLFEENMPKNHRIFHQPSGLAPEAENIKNLPKGYYSNMIAGKDSEWINVYVKGQYGFVSDGKPVYPEYIDRIHYSDELYEPDPKLPLYIGIDFGLTPAAVFRQKEASGRLVAFDELVTFDMGAVNFGKLLHERLVTTYRDFKTIEVWGDPSGTGRAQTDETTPFQILDKQGIIAFPTYTNDFDIRREVPAEYMGRLDFTGKPAFCITKGAPTLRKAYAGGYKFKRLQVSGEERFIDKPNKNKYSHCAEADQYLFLGAVGDDRVIGTFSNKEINYSISNKANV